MEETWLVTGANGYLGGELCLGLHREGRAVSALARPGRPLERLDTAGVPCQTYDDLPEAIAAGDILVHCAGKATSTGAWEDFEQVNVNWTVSLFEQAAQRGARCFVYISSVAAMGYSNRAAGMVLDEQAEPFLLDGELYGRSKQQAECALRERACNASTRLIILRPGLVYGRRAMSGPSGWLRRGTVIDPGQRVPLVHVDSVLSAVVKTVGNPDLSGTFVVVDDEQPTIRELNALKLKLGILHRKPWPLGRSGFRLLCWLRGGLRRVRGLGAPPRGYFETQYAMQTRRLRYNTRRLRESAGWTPAIPLEAGLRACADLGRSTQAGGE